jgi:succinate dehydrogenase (ubiquinone) membrane anchor subunit
MEGVRCFSSQNIGVDQSASAAAPNKLHGSYHWIFERSLSVASLGLVGAAAVNPDSLVDLGLAVVLPLHCHIGFSSIITDYLPARKFRFIYKLSYSALCALTLTTIYGLYSFNTTNVGITEGVKRLWKQQPLVKEKVE